VLLGFLPPTDRRATVLDYDTRTESTALRDHLGVLREGYQVYDRSRERNLSS
jgi:ABC-type Na+ transport system ATPase subunit NatA